ncbi:unnamed protein product [Parnassius mnemosyne]|uniref:RNA-directed DNA polymerase n=1 Tax=Parnassius mnemosyne TaxID=213953 RepID=A0AAV1LSJ6_9NEOP
MANSYFGILSSFNHDIQEWKTYKSRINQWFLANEINNTTDPSGKKRRAILLSALSEGTYRLAENLALPKDVQEVPYEDILRFFDIHFNPKIVGFTERHNFYAASQQPGETHSQWAARLRGLTSRCAFHDIEEALRDRFIMGMMPSLEKEKLYAQDITNLTLTKAVEFAENVRCAKSAAIASASTADASAASTSALYKIRSRGKGARSVKSDLPVKQKCKVCGYTNHKASECRYADFVCRKCNVVGHLRRMCTSNKVNYVDNGAGDEEIDDDGKVFKIRSLRGEPMVETVFIRGMAFKFEIDSGSAVTVIPEKLYKSHFKDIPLIVPHKRLMSYTGDSITCVGTIRLPVYYTNRSHTLDVYVVRDGGPPLLGRDFISTFQLELSSVLSTVNYCQGTLPSVEELQCQFPVLFSDKLGRFTKHKVHLQLKDNAKPVFFKARPIAFALRNKINSELDRMVELGVLKPVDHADYASPIVPVLKRNGTIRLCADYSVSINRQLIIDQYPLPTAKELFAKLYGGKKFTKLDLSMAYNQFELDDESQRYTVINTHRGLYKYTRLVFGLAPAPAIFQRAMEGLIGGQEGVLCLLDDVLITGRDDAEHAARLRAVLQTLQEAGLTLQREKCEFYKDEVNYLGYVINKNGLKKSPDKIKAIVDSPAPSNISQLQSFLGLVNYYRNFVPSAASVLSPLYNLLKKGVKWSWGIDHHEAFTKIKLLLASDQVLAHFNPEARLILTVDASPVGLGAILSQVGSDGQERPISFASRTLNIAEKRYSQIQKEATAIIFGIRRFHQYLYGRTNPFVLRTDHKPLISIFGPYKGIPEVSANRLQRYAMFLSAYNYTIEYIRSADNSADYLSRSSISEARRAPDTGAGALDTCTADDFTSSDRAAFVCFVVDTSLPITVSELRDETKRDKILSKVTEYVKHGWPKKISDLYLKPYFSCRTQFSVENGCLMRGHKIVIPETLRKRVLAELHKTHLGIVKTKAEVRSRFWFPGVDEAVEHMIGTCEVCINLRPSPPRVPPAPWPRTHHPFTRVHMDFLGPIAGRMYLVVIDSYSKWPEIYDTASSTSSDTVIEKMYEFMSRFGIPQTIVSDNGTAFTSQEFKRFCEVNGISHVTSPPYHPASNGQAESYVKIVKKGIKSSIMSSSNTKQSKNNLLKFLFDYRNSKHSTTGMSPAELIFGRKLNSRLDRLVPTSSLSASAASSDLINAQKCPQKEEPVRIKQMLPGTFVLYKKYVNNKFTWCKGTITKRIGKVIYLVKDWDTQICYRKHKNQLILYKAQSNDYNAWDVDAYEKGNTCDTGNTFTPPPSLPASPSPSSSSSSPLHPASTIDPSLVTTAEREGSPRRGERDEAENPVPPRLEEDDEFHEAEADFNGGRIEATRNRLRPRPKVDYKRFF